MRILVFTDSFYPELGGIQDSLSTTCRELGERGHRVLLCVPWAAARDYRIGNLPAGEIDLGANVAVRRLFSLPAPSSTRQSRLLMPTGQRWRTLLRFRPHIVHTHTFLGAGWEAVRAARRLRRPLVGTNHWAIGEFGVYLPARLGPLFARLGTGAVTRFYNQCDLVTGPSRSVIEEMSACGLRAPTSVISNPITASVFRPAAPQERAALKRALGFQAATILYAGRLAVEKRIDVLIHALARLAGEFPQLQLALAGHGSAQPRLERLACELGVASRVRFLGTLRAAALADAYRAADVFAIASTSETQSMALLQALSSGLPAVAVRWRALTEYLPGDAGLLARPGDAGDFAAKLGALLRDPALRAQMSRCAASYAAHFSVSEVVDRWEQIYASMAKAHGASLSDAA